MNMKMYRIAQYKETKTKRTLFCKAIIMAESKEAAEKIYRERFGNECKIDITDAGQMWTY